MMKTLYLCPIAGPLARCFQEQEIHGGLLVYLSLLSRTQGPREAIFGS